MNQTAEPRAVVSWEGPGEPITLTIHGPDGQVAVGLTPVRALGLAKEVTEPAVTLIKTSARGPGYSLANAFPA